MKASRPAAPARIERRQHLRSYLLALLRELFTSKAELASLAGLDRLRRALTEDLCAALDDLGLTGEATQQLAAEAVGAALARRAVSWLRGKVG